MDPENRKAACYGISSNFNPNEYPSVEDPSVFLNPAVSLPYEPGSVLKPITMAMALNWQSECECRICGYWFGKRSGI